MKYIIKKRLVRLIKFVNRETQKFIGFYKGDLVKAYWFDDILNFGDLLTPTLLQKYGLRPINSEKNCAEVVAVGSILDIFPEDYSGYIVGSGLIRDSVHKFPRAKILSVRGKLTRDRIGAPQSTVLGDPGLLADTLIQKNEKIYVVGIVPHYADKTDERIKNIFQHYKNEVLIIDVQRKPKDVISDIDKCSFIISSSLHGIVVADSLGIPNGWILLSDKVIGNGFKFFDYASVFEMKYIPYNITGYEKITDLIKMTHKVSKGIQEVKNKIDNVFIKLCHEILEKKRQGYEIKNIIIAIF